jgi:hypothetical protein
VRTYGGPLLQSRRRYRQGQEGQPRFLHGGMVRSACTYIEGVGTLHLCISSASYVSKSVTCDVGDAEGWSLPGCARAVVRELVH